MTLRAKTLLIISVTFVGLLAGLYLASYFIVLGSFARQEEQDTRQNVERVLSALDDEFSTLESTTADWAQWDDTYLFVQGANQGYVQRTLTDSSFMFNRLNVMLFANNAEQLVFTKAFDLGAQAEVPVPESLRKNVLPGSLLLNHPNSASQITGIILLPEGPMVIASHPILDSAGTGPIRGTLIFGRYLDTAEIERLSKSTLYSLTVYWLADAQMSNDFRVALANLSDETPVFVRPLARQSVAGYTILKDIYEQPALILRADLPRNIYNQGRNTVSAFIVAFALISVTSAAIVMLLLQSAVLSRLARLGASVSRVGASHDPTMRVTMTGRDELTGLANDINDMLQALEMSQGEVRRTAIELSKSMEKLQTLESIVQAFTRVVETRDPYTAGHERRVSQLASAIAKEMGLPGEQVDRVRLTGLLHDLGKIGVPTEILSKPGALREYEFNLIKTHPQVGHQVLKDIAFPGNVAQAVLQHHERLDGSGYPSGLSDEDIVLEARILGVADVVEAMSSHRPYRPAHAIDDALEEVRQKKGKLYDPDVVDACVRLFTEKGFKFES